MKIKEQGKRQKRGSVKRFTLTERLKIIELYYTGYFTVGVYHTFRESFRVWEHKPVCNLWFSPIGTMGIFSEI